MPRLVPQAPAGSCSTAQVVANAFVQQYYHVLHQSPELIYRFYKDSSKLGRPGENGVMGITTTMQAINKKILSLHYGEIRAEIKTVDAQESFNGGVLVLVTGCLTGKDNVTRNFTQNFFLAPQYNGYIVLNDAFRYVEDIKHQDRNQGLVNEMEAPLTPDQDDLQILLLCIRIMFPSKQLCCWRKSMGRKCTIPLRMEKFQFWRRNHQ